jgi:hypothetical protein
MTAPTTQAVQKPDKEKFDAELWAELYTLREAVKGPQGYTSWQDAAVDERMKRHAAERKLSSHEAEVGRLRAENEKLRAALRPFAAFSCSQTGTCNCNNCVARDLLAISPTQGEQK